MQQIITGNFNVFARGVVNAKLIRALLNAGFELVADKGGDFVGWVRG